MKTKKKWKAVLTVSSVLVILLIAALMGGSILIYEQNFHVRYRTASWLSYEPEDFEDLLVEQCYFPSNDGQMLAGYRYSKPDQEIKGLVVLAHGIGAGHNPYMVLADYFASNGYYVFAYDCTACDDSGGSSVGGLPQGVIDLDYALRYVKTVPEYDGLDVVLFGHSWGAYSCGSVLKYHPDVKAVVMVAGMNRSEDMLAYQGRALIGDFVDLALPFVKVYEALKFGQYAYANAMDGFAASDAGVMILHSRDDMTVPACYGYDIFHEGYGESDRFRFVWYEDRGHSNVYYTPESVRYRNEMNQAYLSYVEERNAEHSAQIKEEFFGQFLDIRRAYELDMELMEEILAFFDAYAAK